MGPIGCPETSVTNDQSALRNIPEEEVLEKNSLCQYLSVSVSDCTIHGAWSVM